MRYTLLLTFIIFMQTGGYTQDGKVFEAGAASSNITPKIGTSTNGYFQDNPITHIHDETYAKAIVLYDGETKLAIAVSDLCVIKRETAQNAKQRAHEITGIPMENMMLSATHTHSGGTSCPVFQSDPDPAYLTFIEERIADAIIRAHNNLQPARIGWDSGSEPDQVFCRRWNLKEPVTNPLGTKDMVAMNPGVDNPNKIDPTAPVDPELPVVVIQALTGEYIGLLANYSLHYVGGVPKGDVSADYFSLFANNMETLMGAQNQSVPFVGIMSNGTSGDINNIDFSGHFVQAKTPYVQMEYVANRLAAEAFRVVREIEYQDWVKLGSAQKDITLGIRKPTSAEVERAKDIIAKAEGPVMITREEVYARETMFMKDYPSEAPVLLQAFRIGDLAIGAIPCEPFAAIGLELKEKSAFEDMFTISLANGFHGYLPTPEQHALGGYETWRARTSHLEVNASTEIVATLLELIKSLK